MYTKAVAAFCESGCLHPVCLTHQRYAKLCVVKDKMKQSYGRPFFVCSERENLCKFWQWGDIFESPRPLCLHGLVCCERKVKKDGPNQNRQFYCCPKGDACNFFAWKQQEPRVVNTGIVFIVNTDPADKPGTHWLVIFITTDGKGEFWDPFAQRPGFYSQNFTQFLNKHCSAFTWNRKALQAASSDMCG